MPRGPTDSGFSGALERAARMTCLCCELRSPCTMACNALQTLSPTNAPLAPLLAAMSPKAVVENSLRQQRPTEVANGVGAQIELGELSERATAQALDEYLDPPIGD
eukprot:5890456-Prymnesium_polylepis.2